MPRKRTTRPPRSAEGRRDASINVLTDRLERLEDTIRIMQQTLDVQFRRIASMQVEIDLIRASRDNR